MASAHIKRQVRQVLYAMKKLFAESIIIKNTTGVPNPITGVVVDSVVSATIRRAIVLPERVLKDYEYDLSFIAANKNFTYGGFFDNSETVVIIEKRDMPDTVNLDTDVGTVTINGVENNVLGRTETVDDLSIMVRVRSVGV